MANLMRGLGAASSFAKGWAQAAARHREEQRRKAALEQQDRQFGLMMDFRRSSHADTMQWEQRKFNEGTRRFEVEQSYKTEERKRQEQLHKMKVRQLGLKLQQTQLEKQREAQLKGFMDFATQSGFAQMAPKERSGFLSSAVVNGKLAADQADEAMKQLTEAYPIGVQHTYQVKTDTASGKTYIFNPANGSTKELHFGSKVMTPAKFDETFAGIRKWYEEKAKARLSRLSAARMLKAEIDNLQRLMNLEDEDPIKKKARQDDIFKLNKRLEEMYFEELKHLPFEAFAILKKQFSKENHPILQDWIQSILTETREFRGRKINWTSKKVVWDTATKKQMEETVREQKKLKEAVQGSGYGSR